MRHWHAAYTRPSAEAAVSDSLRARGIDTLFLHEVAEVHHARQVTMTRRPLFSRYVLAAADFDDDLSEIGDTVGVINIVSTTDGPVEIRERRVEELRQLADANGRLHGGIAKTRETLSPGTRVRVRPTGSIDPFVAFVLLDRGPLIRVRMRMFRRWIEGTFDRRSIEILSPEWPPMSPPVSQV